MKNLEEYIRNQFKDIQAEVREIDSKVEDAIFTILKAQQKDKWPYLAAHEKALEAPSNYSFSTNAMILCMLHLADNKVYHEQLYPKISITTNFNKDDRKQRQTALCRLFKELVCLHRTSPNKDLVTTSDTYGNNDPSSLLWISNLIGIYDNSKDKSSISVESSDIDDIKDTILRITNNTLKEKFISPTSKRFQPLNIEKFIPSTNAFIVLKFFLLAKALYIKNPCEIRYFSEARPIFFSFFEQRLHQQLSYNSIPDSRFDPAELVFCLEGISLFNEFKPNDETLERALEVIGQHQSTAPYWRPINPIYATQQGRILLPLSIEVANSLLRTCLSLDKSRDTPMFFSNHLSLFQRYYRWLKAQVRKITIFASNKTFDLWGWESEHVGNPHEIHLWQTSEIASYLMLYRSALQLHIGSETLKRANLLVERPTRKKSNDIDRLIDPIPNNWALETFSIYSFIKKNFIHPQNPPKANGVTAPHSFLLYGPPGTGKTFLTTCIANKLGWKHITITPSDFLAGGSGEVEARAKAIFQCLEQQQKVVILFDEIDHFLLDRESDEYHNQTGIFQFMTPGMLPKLQRLRDKAEKNNFIFAIATNYEERIDPAIKRLGRIDERLPLFPPCNESRREIIKNIIKDKKEKPAWDSSEINRLADLTPLYTYKELSNLLKKHKYAPLSEKPETRFKAKLAQYIPRFLTQQGKLKQLEQTPYEELLLLLFLVCEQKNIREQKDSKAYLIGFLENFHGDSSQEPDLSEGFLEHLKQYPQNDCYKFLTKLIKKTSPRKSFSFRLSSKK